MDELKKKIKKFYIMFGIEAPAAFSCSFYLIIILEKAFLMSAFILDS